MNSLNPQERNLNISEKYYSSIKQLSEDCIKYLYNYKIATGDYLKKIMINHDKYYPRLFEIKNQLKNIDSNIISLATIIPKVVEQQIINIGYFVDGIDTKLENFERILKRKNLEFVDCQNSYKEIKNEINKKYRDIEKCKYNFMTNIALTEETIHKYYIKQKDKKKFSSNLKTTQLEEESNIISNEEQVNNSIQKTKNIEKEYKANILLINQFQKIYLENMDKFKERTKKILYEISNNLKELICDCSIFLKNSFQIPLSEIDTYLDDVVSLEEYSKIDKIIKSSYKKDDFESMNAEKYTLKLFKSLNENEAYKNNIKRKLSTVEEELEEMDFNQEEESFLTIKKMLENFDLLEYNKFDIPLEEEKLRCKYLTLKLLSFEQKNKYYSNQFSNIIQEEVEELKEMLNKKYNRVVFIQKLSQFRTTGIFEFKEKEFNILIDLFNKIIKIVENEEDYDSAINIIILSQTYYILKNNQKEYLQKYIINNYLFKTKKFWEAFVNYSINKEIEESKKTDQINGKNSDNKKIDEEKFSNIVFAQLVPMTDNMIEFGLDINLVEQIILPLIQQYKISPEFSEVVISVINIKKFESIENKF